MALDKKVLRGKQRLILLEAIGQGRIVSDVSAGLLKEVINAASDP